MLEHNHLPEQEFIRELIERKLDQSNLSLRQLAKKWETSISLLSQIKNRKRKANIDLAIRIMQEMDVPVKEKAHYCNLIQNRNSKNISEVSKEIEKQEKTELLSDNFSKILNGENNALDIFLDISQSEGKGCSTDEIIRNYGKQGLGVANLMASSELIKKSNGRYYISLENTHFTPSKQTLFEIINKVNQTLNAKVATNEFIGSFNLEIHDVSEETLDELKKLHKKQVAEVQYLITKNKKLVKDGGIRVTFSHVLGKLKDYSSLCIVLCLTVLVMTLTSRSAMATGGISGGFTDKTLEELTQTRFEQLSPKEDFNDLERIVNQRYIQNQIEEGSEILSTLRLRLKDGNIFKKDKIKANFHKFPVTLDNERRGFETKELAVDYLKAVIGEIKKGKFDQKLINKIKIECQMVSGLTMRRDRQRLALTGSLVEQGLVHNSQMQVKEFINQDFEIRYKIELNLHLPCKLE